MKKTLPLTALVLSLSIAGQAQNWAISDKVSFGHSWTVGNRSDEDLKYAFHPTVAFGRSALYNFNDNIGLGLGTFFSSEGGTFKIDNGSSADKLVQRMNYIRVPLGAIFTLGDPASKVRPHIGLGGSVGFLVGGKTYTISDDDVFGGAKSTRLMSTKVDAGANASLGFSVRVAQGFTINHDVNYYHGLVENNYDTELNPFTHRSLSLSMGFTITGDAMKRWKNKMKGMHED